MDLILQKELPHQQKAVDAVCGVFQNVYIASPARFYENPQISLDDGNIAKNIKELQSALPTEYHSGLPLGDYLNLDIKMETGTGKTYVYTKVMFELHKRYGLNKFIIAVPSLAIKFGTAQFLNDKYARQHFKDSCGYGTEIEVGVLEATKSKKNKRSFFPGVVSDFVKGSCQNTKKIYVLLVNMQLLTTAKMLTRSDYDYGVEGFYRPLDAIRATKPVVIIDEPHRFGRGQKAFQIIVDEIKPQCMIRFGATFPDIVTGRGKRKAVVKDYQNLLYDLNACASFNQGLIKGVAKEHFEPASKREEKLKISSIESKEVVHFQYKKRDEATKSFHLKVGESLAIISDAFEGITISSIGKTNVEFSNGVEKTAGEELNVDIYMTSYQRQMLKLALQRHFETERRNFCDRKFKIKTLALFFIDDITSYRVGSDGKAPYLLTEFEQLLKEQIEETLGCLHEHEAEYKEYLNASLTDISACHAGYFSQDNSNSDEDIAREVDAILHGKKKLLSFRKEDGSYHTLRFLFSKWTLKEGWDNPNVFTIVKLRSSGSENSKLQEVGRGLRLPVDENGNRISNEDFQLNYIVDFTEAEFAEKLVNQINAELPQTSEIKEEKLAAVAKKLGKTADDLFEELFCKHYIDRHNQIRAELRDAFFSEYPDFAAGLQSGKVSDRNQSKPKPVKIRKEVYQDIRTLWEMINRRCVIFYEDDLDGGMESVVLSIFEKAGVLTDMVVRSQRDLVRSDGAEMSIVQGAGVQYTINKTLPYHMFLKRISTATSLPITVLHSALCAYHKKHGTDLSQYINENTAAAFCAEFAVWRNENLWGHFGYEPLETPLGATALTFADGSARDEIARGRIGTRTLPGTPGSKYLYDEYVYDSPLEKENITAEAERVIAYGKIPRRSIAIPTITGGMYSPDFMFALETDDSGNQRNVVAETKDVEDNTEIRGTERVKIGCAKVFFETLAKYGCTVQFCEQLGGKQISQMIAEMSDK